MPGIQKSVRIPEDTLKEIEELARETGKDFSSVAKDLLKEAIKMRRCPGIVFAEGATGRRARVAGTGLEVWEVISTYRSVNQDAKRLQKAYHWLSQGQLRSALAYSAAYPKEIDELMERNASWDEEKLKSRHPFAGSPG